MSNKCDIISCEAEAPSTWAYCDEHYQMLYGGEAPIRIMNRLQAKVLELESQQVAGEPMHSLSWLAERIRGFCDNEPAQNVNVRVSRYELLNMAELIEKHAAQGGDDD